MNIPTKRKQIKIVRFYPNNYLDLFTIELVKAEKELKLLNTIEKGVGITDEQDITIRTILEIRFLKMKIKFFATLLTQ